MEAEAYQKSTAAVEHSGLATTQGGVGALCIENQALTDKKDKENIDTSNIVAAVRGKRARTVIGFLFALWSVDRLA